MIQSIEIQKFFNGVSHHFDLAKRQGECDVRKIEIGGNNIQLNIIGQKLVRALIPAIEHIESESLSLPEFEINLWDSQSLGLSDIKFLWNDEDVREHGLIKGFNTERFKVCFIHGSYGLNLLDVDAKRGFFWISDVDELRYFEKAAPLRFILHWWLRTMGIMLTHAGAVGSNNKGVLIVGKGGSGKSTTSLSCLAEGMNYLSDDYCMTSLHGGGTLHSIYNTAKMDKESISNFPYIKEIFDGIKPTIGEKYTYVLNEKYGSLIRRSMPLKAIIIPIKSERLDPSINKVSQIKAIKSLAPSALFQIPDTGSVEFEHFVNLIRLHPCYELHLCPDLKKNAAFLRHFINSNL